MKIYNKFHKHKLHYSTLILNGEQEFPHQQYPGFIPFDKQKYFTLDNIRFSMNHNKVVQIQTIAFLYT